MSSETMKTLEEAIAAHYADRLSEVAHEIRPVVTTWVLAVEVQSIEDGDLMWTNHYTTAETATPNSRLGLAFWLSDTLREVRADTLLDDDKDGDR
jgi:hypothetical protein